MADGNRHKDRVNGETSGSGTRTAMSRREFLRDTGKAAYVAPVLTILPLASVGVGANSLPPVPDSIVSPDVLHKQQEQLLLQERIPAGPDPLDMFGGGEDKSGG
jgi:hypothetical protein